MKWERNDHEEDECCFCPAERWLQNQGMTCFFIFEQTAIMGKCDNADILKRITRPPRQCSRHTRKIICKPQNRFIRLNTGPSYCRRNLKKLHALILAAFCISD